MKVLVHLGLNKCASTYVQHALDGTRCRLARAGVWYPAQDGPPCQYGLSRALGFGPDVPEVAPQTVAGLVGAARAAGCERMILSSEYMSLCRPRAAAALVADLDHAGCTARFVLISRHPLDWIRSLFNQYVRSVEGDRALPHIDAFVDQVLGNHTVDIAGRHAMWAGIAGAGALDHYRLTPDLQSNAVLQPFAEFASMAIAPAEDACNASVGIDALWRIGQLRAKPRARAEETELNALLDGQPTDRQAPAEYGTISHSRLNRLEDEVIRPYRALPYQDLVFSDVMAA